MALSLLLLWACRPTAPAADAALGRGEVLLAHTNDLHAHFLPAPAPWLPGTPELGGFVAIDAHLSALRASAGALVYLDGGDLLSGTPLMELEEHGVAGGAMLSFLDAVGCDGWVVGNHELDRGLDHAQRFVAASEVPVLTANLRDPSGQRPLLDGTVSRRVVAHNDLRIGVFGLTTDAMAGLTSRETAAALSMMPLAEAAREQVSFLEGEGVDLIVALTHAGLDADRRLAASVDGIDLIVGGHTHSSVEPPQRVEQTWIVQAGSYGRQLGVLRFSVDDGEIEGLSGALVDLDPEALPGPASEAVVALSGRLSRALEAEYGAQVGLLPAELTRSEQGDSTLGRWAAEVVRQAAGADIGAVNAGGLRADLAAGPISRGDLYQVFPFNNAVVSFPVTGRKLLGILLQAAARELEGRVPMQLSGAELVWRVHLGAPEVVSVTVGGQPLVLEQVYQLATSSFLADQADRRFGVAGATVTDHGLTVLDAAAAALTGGLTGPPEGAGRRRSP